MKSQTWAVRQSSQARPHKQFTVDHSWRSCEWGQLDSKLGSASSKLCDVGEVAQPLWSVCWPVKWGWECCYPPKVVVRLHWNTRGCANAPDPCWVKLHREQAMEKAGLKLHRLLVLELEIQRVRQRSGGYRVRTATSFHLSHPAQIYTSQNKLMLRKYLQVPKQPWSQFLFPLSCASSKNSYHPSLLTSGHNPCSWPSVLRKFVITKKEFPCGEKGEKANAKSPWERNFLIIVILLAKCLGASLSTLLSFSLEIRVWGIWSTPRA